MLNKEQIKEIIPYDEPFLFVDEVLEMEENRISGTYQTSEDDYYFKGHFVDFKIMPGVLVVEALAQLSTIILRKKTGENHKDYHFLAYDVKSVQFLKPMFPGDKIILKNEILGIYPAGEDPEATKIARVKGQAFVGEDLKIAETSSHLPPRPASQGLACEARFSVAIVNKKEFSQKHSH
jgi:3-hydroxyacyl-[acyl-carrier-protein] dehydratase